MKQDLHVYLENGKVKIYYFTLVFGLTGYILDVISFLESPLVLYNNLVTIFITVSALALYLFRKSNFKLSYGIMVYAGILNMFTGTIADPWSEQGLSFFLRDSLFVMVGLTLSALVVNKIHALIVGGIFLAYTLIYAIVAQNVFLKNSLYIIFIFVGIFSYIVYYVVLIIEKSLHDLEVRRRTIETQNHKVKRINTLLMENQQQIEEQTEELGNKSKKLEQQSVLLHHKNGELDNLVRMKDKFISIIAHDLKNPLNVIMGFSDLLYQKYDSLSEEKKKNYIENLKKTADNTCNLLQNLLQWANAKSGNMDFKPQRVSLLTLVEENIRLMQEAAQQKDITLAFQCGKDIYIYADANMINTVIRNLLTNGIKFTSKGGEIRIICSRMDSIVQVIIKDNGIGMEEEKIRTLFTINKGRSIPGTAGESGSGLGLLICKEFIEKNEGTIEVVSKPGEGSTFIFSLPAAGAEVNDES